MNMSKLMLILSGFLIGSAHIHAVEPADTAQNVCKTESCLESSNALKFSMNLDVDPCDNFYKYACGNFGKWKADKHKANESYTWLTEMEVNKTARIKDFLHSELKKSAPVAVKKVQLLYQSCMDTDAMNKKGYEPLRQLLKDIGVSPDPPFNIHAKNFSWIYSAAKVKRLLNKDFLISVQILPHYEEDDNKTSYKINLLEPIDNGIQIPDSFSKSKRKDSNKFFDSTNPFASAAQFLPEGFFKYARTLVELINGSKNTTELEEKIIDFGIAELATFTVMRRRPSWSYVYPLVSADLFKSKDMTLQEIQNLTDTAITKGDGKKLFNWEEYFKTLLEGVEGASSIDLKKEKIRVEIPAYIKIIASVVGEQSPHLLERAIWFDVVSSVAGMTTDEMRVLQYGDENGNLSTTKIQERCYQLVQQLMGLAIEHHFLDDEAVVQTKVKLISLLKHLKTALGIIISDADWMDNTTKKVALEKIKKMKQQISHPHWLRNVTLLNEYYDDIKIYGPNNFMLTYLKRQESAVISTLKRLQTYSDSDDEINLSLEVDPFTINAFYVSSINKMYVPQGIISRPFYGHAIEALNYGGLGLVIGHEITHGFDNSGRKYDADGQQVDWWQDESSANYKNRTQCFIDSYSSITVGNEKELQCDGRRSLNENIADNGGFHESLMAYRYHVKENGVEPLLYGFENFTHEQLYTLSFANVWCDYMTDIDLLTYIRDAHGPYEARVRGVTMNSNEFAEIWKCPKGSKMNPDKPKCHIW